MAFATSLQPVPLQKSSTFGGTPGGSNFGLTLGAAQTATVKPFSFGGGASTSTAPQLSFGTNNPAPTSSLNFGTSTTSSAPFGMTPQPTASSSSGLSFTSGGLNFGGSGGMALNLSTSTAGGTGLNFGGGGLNYGGSLTQPSSTAGLNFGGGLTQPASSVGGFLGSAPPISTSQQLTAAQPAPRGLGGTDSGISSSSQGLKSSSKSDGTSETTLPVEIKATVDEFQKFLKAQRSIREESTHFSAHPINKVKDEVVALAEILSSIRRLLARNQTSSSQLKGAVASDLRDAEMSQRTQEVPAAYGLHSYSSPYLRICLQYENVAPQVFFERKLASFERDAAEFRRMIESLEGKLKSAGGEQELTLEDLRRASLKLHTSVFTAASHLHRLHTQLQRLVQETPLSTLGVFGQFPPASPAGPSNYSASFDHLGLGGLVRETALGPSPFSAHRNSAVLASHGAYQRSQTLVGVPSGGMMMMGTGGGGGSSSGFLLGTPQPNLSRPGYPGPMSTGSLFSTPSLPPPAGVGASPFALQGPPLGSKRGKRF